MVKNDQPGPAFPVVESAPIQYGRLEATSLGFSIREYFAAKAMQGLLSGHYADYKYTDEPPAENLAAQAFMIADAMIVAGKE